ncbi:MAG: hypothetical protein ACJA09_000696 [Alcanivorax sp.]|jgi:hypothetical protein
MAGQSQSAQLVYAAVIDRRQKFSNKPLLWTLLCLALFVGVQVMEAGHIHDSGVAHTECIKCQKDSTKAIPSAGIQLASFTFTPQRVVASTPNVTKARLEFAPIRGPPSQLL